MKNIIKTLVLFLVVGLLIFISFNNKYDTINSNKTDTSMNLAQDKTNFEAMANLRHKLLLENLKTLEYTPLKMPEHSIAGEEYMEILRSGIKELSNENHAITEYNNKEDDNKEEVIINNEVIW